jgi:hypothetical protein
VLRVILVVQGHVPLHVARAANLGALEAHPDFPLVGTPRASRAYLHSRVQDGLQGLDVVESAVRAVVFRVDCVKTMQI